MKMQVIREKVYSRQLGGYIYRAILNGMSIDTAATKEEAEQKAYQRLFDALENIGGSCAVRVAKDGTIIVVRPLSKTDCMTEHCRGGRSSGCSFGRMSMMEGGNMVMAKDVHEFADYTLAQYDEVAA